jgi:hypothetical protein
VLSRSSSEPSCHRRHQVRNPPGLWPSGKNAFSTIRSTQSYQPARYPLRVRDLPTLWGGWDGTVTLRFARQSPARDPSDLAGTARDITTVLAAVHHAADAISRTADQDAQAVCQAAADHQLYMPTRLLPDHYDIPHPYTRVCPQLAGDLLDAYDTVTTASLHAAEALDTLAVTLGAPSSMLAAARTSPSRQVKPRRRPAHNGARQQPPSGPLAGDSRPQPGQTELILRRLQITEPALLLRAAAVDEAARDLLARAAASSRQRNTIDQPIPPGIGAGIRRTARTAAQDVPLPVQQPAAPMANASVTAGRIEVDSRALRAQPGRGLTA